MKHIPAFSTDLARARCNESIAQLAIIHEAARLNGMEIPDNPVHYDPQTYPHWDFLIRYAQRKALCACAGSWEQRVQDAQTTVRVYMEHVMVQNLGFGES